MLLRAVARLPRALPIHQRCSLQYLRLPPWLATPTGPPALVCPQTTRTSSTTSSSARWRTRQRNDPYTLTAKLAGLKSRAAYKLLEIDAKHRLFSRGDTVVDLGYAPGSWSQVAVNRTGEGGKVVGIDVIPAQPPRGVSTLQGDFLSEGIQEEVRKFVREGVGRRQGLGGGDEFTGEGGEVELERQSRWSEGDAGRKEMDAQEGRVVDVVLSDMCEPWPQVSSTWIKSVSNPYRRMMNTSGMAFRDHAGSMDLCNAALTFCYDTLVTGGNFLCKFYQGTEDHDLEVRMKRLFEKVHRIKPESSRKESKEAYLVCLRRRAEIKREEVIVDNG